MPREAEIRKKAIEILTSQKWICWFAPKVKFRQTDVFGIIDLLALKGKKQKNIQLILITLILLILKYMKVKENLQKIIF